MEEWLRKYCSGEAISIIVLERHRVRFTRQVGVMSIVTTCTVASKFFFVLFCFLFVFVAAAAATSNHYIIKATNMEARLPNRRDLCPLLLHYWYDEQ